MDRAVIQVKIVIISLLLGIAPSLYAAPQSEPTAEDLIRGAIHLWRGKSSYISQTMLIHRPDWERRVSMLSVTQGDKDALVRFTAPPKDAGNATLKRDRDMWIFTPKLNHVTKLPSSMMAQSWMGSDFSYDDLAKSDEIVDDYTFRIIATETAAPHVIYSVEGVPKPDASVVWGKETYRIRDDFVMLERNFFDQDMKLVRRMSASKVAPLDGRDYPVELRMETLEEKQHWTMVQTESGRFDIGVPDFIFTLSNLRNPRPWKPK